MMRRRLAARLRPVAFATVTAVVGAGAATIGLSPDENAAAAERGRATVVRVLAESGSASALARLLTGEGLR